MHLEVEERARFEAAISEVKTLSPRQNVLTAGEPLDHSILLIEGFMSRYIDRNGLRQLVAVHVPGDFVDLHAFSLEVLDHDVATMTAATVALVPHSELEILAQELPKLTLKLRFSTLIDAAIHRAWLFRLGRLNAVERIAHFISETNVRLMSAGLSDGRRFALGLIQPDLAEICGLTNVHIYRVLRQLREQKLCVFRSSLVEILDPEKLADQGHFDPAYLYIDLQSTDALSSHQRPTK
ncbi:Crp/Fnr family transcriptional regulator [Sphingobium phenoxybenzoativorans]|uniref:Crp/Fnr family transcriptional regulator n=1 Tax=Sphingobium phenoxybenzoativorans TaxID=1592790 RepID=UPI000871D5E1